MPVSWVCCKCVHSLFHSTFHSTIRFHISVRRFEMAWCRWCKYVLRCIFMSTHYKHVLNKYIWTRHYHSLVKEPSPITFSTISCIGSKFTLKSAHLEQTWPLVEHWEAQPQALCLPEVEKFHAILYPKSYYKVGLCRSKGAPFLVCLKGASPIGALSWDYGVTKSCFKWNMRKYWTCWSQATLSLI